MNRRNQDSRLIQSMITSTKYLLPVLLIPLMKLM